MWRDPSLLLVEVSPQLMYKARDLMRNAIALGYVLKPLDAIHLVTAQWVSEEDIPITGFHTYDKTLTKYQQLIGGIPICEPVPLIPRLPFNY
jgi:predicted nucleic acid-binding protein